MSCPNSIYTRPVEDDEDVMTVESFRATVAAGGFIDYDGFGYPVRGGLAASTVVVLPSRVDEIPADATHIVWFNR